MPDPGGALSPSAPALPRGRGRARSRLRDRRRLRDPQSEVALVHAAVDAMEDIKRRADFEVYLKKFLQSLDLILPHAAATALSRSGSAVRLSAAHDQGALQGRFPRHHGRRRKGAGADQRASRRSRHQPQDPARRALRARFHRARPEPLRRATPRPRRARWSTPSASTARSTSTKTPRSTRSLSEKLEKLIEAHRDNWHELARRIRTAPPVKPLWPYANRRRPHKGSHYVLRLRRPASPSTAACPMTSCRSSKTLMVSDRRDAAADDRHHRFLEEADRGEETARQH